MPEVIDWRQSADPALIDRTAQALASGRLVVFPTETVYGVAASVESIVGMERLATCKGRPEEKPFTLAIGRPDIVHDWLPQLGLIGRRLASRCWPGPITMVSGEGIDEGRSRLLPDAIRQRVCPSGAIGMRVPAHSAILQVLAKLSAPLALTSANRSGEPEAISADEASEAMADSVDLIITDGRCRYAKPSTVVQVADGQWKILREGTLPADSVQRLLGCVIVFVCTGNTCRSPLAEALFKKMLADQLGCTVEDLPSRGFVVRSAGISAVTGAPAAQEAVEVAAEFGADLTRHASRPLTPELAAHADYLLVMTQGHLRSLTLIDERRFAAPRLLCTDGSDISDPIGLDFQVYQECARQIRSALTPLLAEVVTK